VDGRREKLVKVDNLSGAKGCKCDQIPPVVTDALYASHGATGEVPKARNFLMANRVHPVGSVCAAERSS
jgi:hypothetical protein